MSNITDTHAIDIIGKKGTEVSLHISDHLMWDDEDFAEHLELLNEKVNTYLEFVKSGQLHRMKGLPENPTVCIELDLMFEPNSRAKPHLEHAKAILAEQGIEFVVKVRTKGK